MDFTARLLELQAIAYVAGVAAFMVGRARTGAPTRLPASPPRDFPADSARAPRP